MNLGLRHAELTCTTAPHIPVSTVYPIPLPGTQRHVHTHILHGHISFCDGLLKGFVL